MIKYNWSGAQTINSSEFLCWDCSKNVASNMGYSASDANRHYHRKIYICPNCDSPNFFDNLGTQYPGVKYGNPVDHLPDSIKQAYNEARNCFSVSAYTASALICRKILMNIAVSKGADENKNFAYYVNWLDENRYIPPDSKNWVDHIRNIGNQGTHEIMPISKEDAEELITFSEMLLRIIFEFNAKMKKKIES